VDLVVELRLHGPLVHRSAGAVEFRDDGGLSGNLGQREAQPVGVRHDAVGRVLEVAAGAVHAAFEEVTDHGRVAHGVPVVERPAELVADRADEQRRVGQPSADGDLGVLAQAVDDPLCTDVGVGRDDPVAEGAHRRVQLGQHRVLGADQVEHVVAADHAQADAGQPDLTQAADEIADRRIRVGGAEVADHPAAGGEVPAQQRYQPADPLVLTGRGVPSAPHVGEGHGPLGQAVEPDVGDPAAVGHRRGGSEAVVRVGRAGPDGERPRVAARPQRRHSLFSLLDLDGKLWAAVRRQLGVVLLAGGNGVARDVRVSIFVAREEDGRCADTAQTVSLTAFLVDTYLHRKPPGRH
jgi:hypothetical protein